MEPSRLDAIRQGTWSPNLFNDCVPSPWQSRICLVAPEKLLSAQGQYWQCTFTEVPLDPSPAPLPPDTVFPGLFFRPTPAQISLGGPALLFAPVSPFFPISSLASVLRKLTRHQMTSPKISGPPQKCQFVVFPRGAQGHDLVFVGQSEALQKRIRVQKLVGIVVD